MLTLKINNKLQLFRNKIYICQRIIVRKIDMDISEENLQSKDPFVIFDQWFNEAKKCDKIIEPNAMCLATANKNSVPSARFVLCKGYGNKGFKFFTHYTSRKGQELEENPQAALTFYWAPFSRSVKSCSFNILITHDINYNTC
ncbi:pyridoxine-5'-phosphate oxidase-like isoform X2 [Agrilus planipennis]|uniref:pyridoxal 5'-phosphate synthase n=2 Tax=Agrilus planipennis TaxID=224129 RepID=A0A7F5RHA3_AGRPL|nr:pyridoxine-5'-phosphate oxidase-like isoform X2 [Agrilus planipennis]